MTLTPHENISIQDLKDVEILTKKGKISKKWKNFMGQKTTKKNMRDVYRCMEYIYELSPATKDEMNHDNPQNSL